MKNLTQNTERTNMKDQDLKEVLLDLEKQLNQAEDIEKAGELYVAISTLNKIYGQVHNN